MKVAIVHYHLRRGGVTRVIESAVAALAPHDVDVVVLTGQDYEGQALKNVRTVPGLAYRTDLDDGPDPEALAANLTAAARDGLEGADPDIWHVHNHSLGKNAAFVPALQELLMDGRRVLLQIHDFAEDGRPSNYEVLRSGARYVEGYGGVFLPYPLAPNVRYAVLNGRDAEFLRKAGAPPQTVHLLPNPVHLPNLDEPETRPFAEYDRLFVYPVRGIRRKNLGELVLLAAAAPEGSFFVTTLTPENPVWRPIHDEWGHFCRQHDLPVELGAVDNGGHNFIDLIQRADALVNTSIAEGFGMAFLEPWMFGSPLIGRNLPEITQDFTAHGLNLDGLYNRIEVSVEAFDLAAFRQRLSKAMEEAFRTYGRHATDAMVDQAITAWIEDDAIDFGVLDEEAQRQAILHILNSTQLQGQIWEKVLRPATEDGIQDNRQVVIDQFSLDQYGRALHDVYDELLQQNTEVPQKSLTLDRLLDCFLDPTRFRTLRS